METTIVVPPVIYKAAEKRAGELGLSLSEFTALVLRGVLSDPAEAYLTRRLEEVYTDEDSRLDPAVLTAQMSCLPMDDW